MITDADIKKMKAVFATKDEMNERFEGIDKRFDGMDKKIDQLSNTLHKSTNDLIELITDGFNLTDKRLDRLEDKVFGTN